MFVSLYPAQSGAKSFCRNGLRPSFIGQYTCLVCKLTPKILQYCYNFKKTARFLQPPLRKVSFVVIFVTCKPLRAFTIRLKRRSQRHDGRMFFSLDDRILSLAGLLVSSPKVVSTILLLSLSAAGLHFLNAGSSELP